MSRHATRLVACVAALLAFVSPVGAHADYEQPLVNVVTPDGRPLLLVKRFTDGIIGNDPVKLVLYDARTSTVVAETDYYRDIRTGGGDIYYCYEATSLACERVVRFTPEGQWVDEPPGSYAAASVLAYYAGHWVMHGVVAAMAALVCTTYLVEVCTRFRMSWLRQWLFAGACLMVYVLLMGLPTTLLTAVFAAVLGVAVAMVSVTARKRLRSRPGATTKH